MRLNLALIRVQNYIDFNEHSTRKIIIDLDLQYFYTQRSYYILPGFFKILKNWNHRMQTVFSEGLLHSRCISPNILTHVFFCNSASKKQKSSYSIGYQYLVCSNITEKVI